MSNLRGHDSQGRETKIDIEHLRKRKAEAGQTNGVSSKKIKGFDSRSKGQKGQSRCGKCGRLHEGVCRAGGSGCYKCGKTGTLARIVQPLPPRFIHHT